MMLLEYSCQLIMPNHAQTVKLNKEISNKTGTTIDFKTEANVVETCNVNSYMQRNHARNLFHINLSNVVVYTVDGYVKCKTRADGDTWIKLNGSDNLG